MLGDKLLVAPIFRHDNIAEFYVPAGRWTNFLNGEVLEGPGWQRQEHDFLNLPLLVRPNSILPVGRQDQRPDYDYADGVTLQIYELEEGHHDPVVVRGPDGGVAATFHVERTDSTITIRAEGTHKPWQAQIADIQHQPPEGGKTLTIQLETS